MQAATNYYRRHYRRACIAESSEQLLHLGAPQLSLPKLAPDDGSPSLSAALPLLEPQAASILHHMLLGQDD